MKLLPALLALVVFSVCAQDVDQKIVPVKAWPRVIYFEGKQIVNPSISTCVRAGYRMLTPKPATPSGKWIKSEKIIQDDKDSSKCKYDIMYEDIPEPVIPDPPVPEITTNIILGRLAFTFSTNGYWRGIEWLDAPQTNIAVGE